jgi:hypothetical protein
MKASIAAASRRQDVGDQDVAVRCNRPMTDTPEPVQPPYFRTWPHAPSAPMARPSSPTRSNRSFDGGWPKRPVLSVRLRSRRTAHISRPGVAAVGACAVGPDEEVREPIAVDISRTAHRAARLVTARDPVQAKAVRAIETREVEARREGVSLGGVPAEDHIARPGRAGR